MTALALASWIGYTEMVTMLLKAGADANQEASEVSRKSRGRKGWLYVEVCACV
jgi:ankyrin repeat protein